MTVIVNVLGDSAEEYARLAEELSRAGGVSMIELNVSCPQREGPAGIAFGIDPEATTEVVKAAVGAGDLPVMVKLTPMTADIVTIARAAEAAGASALSLINTIPAMAIDLETRRPKLANVIGGLSGPAIKPVALRLVWQTARSVDVPVVGIGGISTIEDALEFMLAGACAVQIGTANFFQPVGCPPYFRRAGRLPGKTRPGLAVGNCRSFKALSKMGVLTRPNLGRRGAAGS